MLMETMGLLALTVRAIMLVGNFRAGMAMETVAVEALAAARPGGEIRTTADGTLTS